MHDYDNARLSAKTELACVNTDAHRPRTVLELSIDVAGPNIPARELLAQITELTDTCVTRCRDCQAIFDAEASGLAMLGLEQPTTISIDERIHQTRKAIGLIADLWGSRADDVGLTIRHTDLALYHDAFFSESATTGVTGSPDHRKSFTEVKLPVTVGSPSSFTLQIYGDHTPEVAAAFDGHWPQAFVPHKLTPAFENTAMCQACGELIIEHKVAQPGKDEDLVVWDPEQAGKYGAPAPTSPPVDAPEFGDEGHDSGSPDAEQRAYSAAAPASMATRDTGNGHKHNESLRDPF